MTSDCGSKPTARLSLVEGTRHKGNHPSKSFRPAEKDECAITPRRAPGDGDSLLRQFEDPMRKILFALAVCLVIPVSLQAQPQPPEGWRFPGESDYSDDWLKYRETHPVPFHVSSDFNGDGTTDDAWIVIPKKGDGGGLCVLLARKDAPPDVIWLDRGEMVYKPQRVGIVAVPPGHYRTACGKGYFECGPGEPETLDLSRPSFQFIYFGKAGILYWWDATRQSFSAATMSD